MKKFWLFSLIIMVAVLIFTGCGSDETSADKDENQNESAELSSANKEEKAQTNNSTDDSRKDEPVEPDENTLCAVCNMKVYPHDHEMGVFTGQGITKSGETVFFDDVGCILNYERATGEELKIQWVRDYETLEWTETNKAIPVKTNLKSPMKWGYVFFDSREKAERFIAENSELNGEITDWETIDQLAAERYEKKMKSMKSQHESGHSDHEQDQNHDDHHQGAGDNHGHSH